LDQGAANHQVSNRDSFLKETQITVTTPDRCQLNLTAVGPIDIVKGEGQ
jgi:hypothetical protein